MPIEARHLFDEMPERNIVSWNGLVSGYIKNGMINEAREAFEMMPERNVVSWTAMVKGYVQEGMVAEAIDLFGVMQRQGVRPSFPSLISVLSVCGALASLEYGRQVHAHLVRCRFDVDVYVASVLMTMYVKCGELVKAKLVFDRFPSKDVIMWNSIISGYASHGLGEEALKVFHEMPSSGTMPNKVTIVAILTACSYAGKVEEGVEIFESMESRFCVAPSVEHYSCTVDMLGRAGRIDEAMKLIETMTVKPDATVWGALLGACRTHSRLDLAEVAAKKLFEIEPENAGPYVLLSSINASRANWGDVAEMRKDMRNKNVSKFPGCSWIEVDKKVHTFFRGDIRNHPEKTLISMILE
ncbi:hypothetical protein F2Q69_00041351, partial [Brassica cretica]